MQFRRKKDRLHLLAYRGYSKEKKRSIVKMVGTIDWQTLQVPPKVQEALNETEKAELQVYLDAERKQRRVEAIRQTAQNLPGRLKTLNNALAAYAEALPAACDSNWAVQTWSALREMEDHLRRHGLRKPHRPKS